MEKLKIEQAARHLTEAIISVISQQFESSSSDIQKIFMEMTPEEYEEKFWEYHVRQRNDTKTLREHIFKGRLPSRASVHRLLKKASDKLDIE